MATRSVRSHYRKSSYRRIKTKTGTSVRYVKGGSVRSYRRRK